MEQTIKNIINELETAKKVLEQKNITFKRAIDYLDVINLLAMYNEKLEKLKGDKKCR